MIVVGRDLAAVDRRRGGDHLEGGPGRVGLLGRAVEDRLVRVRAELRGVLGDQVRVVVGHGRHHADLPGSRLDRHHRALAALEGGVRRPLGVHVEVRDHVEALPRPVLEPGQDRLELVLLPGQLVVAVALEGAPAVEEERVADGMGEQPALGVDPGVDPLVAAAARHAARQHRAVVAGQDAPARYALLLEQRPAVGLVVLETRGLEHRPARGEDHEQPEEEREEPEQLGDLPVHLRPARLGAGARRVRGRKRSGASPAAPCWPRSSCLRRTRRAG